ncbi:LacI family DNA-binding transcriptional regulator [Pseudogulbenkiania ferrooxidans]|uniref:Transcriptional regulator, LacI family n=1 Tax=Pseudogulbenkiania ferrooxidans 2002 TaxID=279714 RepID=B9Z754_9NEIS|nr:LacI family DNA-binding transcriptional regulator [Pseudogulbenkiania ferrooxidans]EEG07369.1 transcriptional regulator, LacI family [Pseudogulbenkiania ferrooxidans 2002]
MSAKIKDVAAAAGVSVATVSRALGSGPVSAALRQRVEEAAKQLGYRPNLSARRLRSQHTQTVGLIVSDIRNPFFTAVSRAVEDAAYQAGMRVILCNTDENPDKEAMYLRLMEEERVSGVIFSPTRDTARRLRPDAYDFPVVMIDRAGPAGQADAVVLDNRLAARQLVEHLVAQGYRHIGGLFGNTSSTGAERHAGFEAALAAHGLAGEGRFIAPTAEAAEAVVTQWLAEEQRPDALIASNGLLLLGALRALQRAGLSSPHDLALAGFDNEVWTGLVGNGLTVIEQPVYEIGRTAMEMLLSRLDDPGLSIRSVVLAGRLLVRGSTSPHPSA